MNNIESPADIERARNVFERAITVVGLHVTEVMMIIKNLAESSFLLQLHMYSVLHSLIL